MANGERRKEREEDEERRFETQRRKGDRVKTEKKGIQRREKL